MPTLNLTLAADADDDSGSTAFGLLGGIILATGKISGAFSVRTFLRYTGVTIGQGDTINSATLSAVAVDTDSSSTWTTKIHCNAADNPSNPANGTALDALALTTAFTSPTSSLSTTSGVRYNFDVTSAVQEIVNRAGWVSGNAIMIVWVDNGSSNGIQRRWSARENGTSNAAKLDITYTAGASGQPAIKRHGGVPYAMTNGGIFAPVRRW